MGAPFKLTFVRSGSGEALKIDAMRIMLHESTGCLLAELQNLVVVPEVLAAKAADGKGARVIGKFIKLEDPELHRKIADQHPSLSSLVGFFPLPDGKRDGSMEFETKLRDASLKIGLLVKRHPLFGKLESAFQ
jgi:hypothetical protein